MEKYFEEMLEIMTLFNDENFYGKIKNFSQIGFQMFLGMITDQYGADNKLSSKETIKMIDDLAKVQKEVHNNLGNATPLK